MIALIDYGAGNLHSVHNALRKAGAHDVAITADADVVARADRIVLPGVGAFRACRDALVAIPGMVDAMNEAVNGRGAPFLGVCVGMQLLATKGLEFGQHEGLGWIEGEVRRLEPSDPHAKVPHMGWNAVEPSRPHPLLGEAGPETHMYFTHSFAFHPERASDVLATTDHAGRFVSAVARDNVAGVQFHPEKSQAAGLAMIGRFLEWRP